ncbi:MAG: hypothetical protein QM372_05405 [Bacillota bacterium]|nr:hypothetical protein [Bacillota bacterium]
MNYTVTYLAYFTPIILTALVVVLIITLRWFTYKERMGMIAQGVLPENGSKDKKNHKILLAVGLVVGLSGLALTIGLITLGVGPWLLAGLIPLFVGLALILVSLILAPAKPKEAKEEPVQVQATVEEAAEPAPEDVDLEEDEEQEVV